MGINILDEIGKDKHNMANKKWRKNHPEYKNKYYTNHKKQIQQYAVKHRQTVKGKISHKRGQAARRTFGYIPLIFIEYPNCIVDWHHVDDEHVIPVPRKIHQSMLGKTHRIQINNWIENTLGFSITNLLEMSGYNLKY